MIHLAQAIPSDIVRDVGWTLIHFLWQGALLAALLHVILPLCRSAATRHNWALGTLLAMAFAPLATFLLVHRDGGSVVPPEAVSGLVPATTDPAGGMLAATSIPMLWVDWVVALWLAGIALLSLRALGGWYLAETLRRRDTFALPPAVLQRCTALQSRLASTWPVQFLQSRRVSAPVVIGWLRPVILIPMSAITGLTPEQLDALIMHELAHIRRLDAFINVLLLTVETILFYHPAVWWVSRRIRVEREHCCDDFAVSNCGDAPLYVEALASLEATRSASLLALAAGGGMLKERVTRLLGVPSEVRQFSLSAMAGLVFLGAVIAGVAAAQNSTSTPDMRFAISAIDESVDGNAAQGPSEDDRVRAAAGINDPSRAVWLKRQDHVGENTIADAQFALGPAGEPTIQFRLTPEGQAQFSKLTGANIGKRLAVVVNGTVISAPRVKSQIVGGRGVIEGKMTEAEARKLAADLRTMIQSPAAPAREGAASAKPAIYDASADLRNGRVKILQGDIQFPREKGADTLIVNGYVFNMDTIVKKLPGLRLELYNDKKEVVRAATGKPAAALLDPGVAAKFEIRMELPPSTGAPPADLQKSLERLINGGLAVVWDK